MVAFPVPERIKLVIASSQLDPLESIRHCASMRNSPRVVHEGRLFPENLRGDSVDYVFQRSIEIHRRNTRYTCDVCTKATINVEKKMLKKKCSQGLRNITVKKMTMKDFHYSRDLASPSDKVNSSITKGKKEKKTSRA